MNLAYPKQAAELIQLLQEDQTEGIAFAKKYFDAVDKSSLDEEKSMQHERIAKRAERALKILDEIKEPTLSNIGEEGAQALSILTLHASSDALQKCLRAFEISYANNKEDTYSKAIPSMTDWVLIIERKPQKFGTQWLFDSNNYPFLYPVEDFEHVNERRTEYGIEPFRWPRSMAWPEEKQPWLKRPLSELVMRMPTDQEYTDNFR